MNILMWGLLGLIVVSVVFLLALLGCARVSGRFKGKVRK